MLTYTISGGEDSASFDIDRATGQIMVGAGTMLDFEAGERSYTSWSRPPARGMAMLTPTMIMVTINVTNVDEDPELTGMDSLRPMENTGHRHRHRGRAPTWRRTMRTERQIRRP